VEGNAKFGRGAVDGGGAGVRDEQAARACLRFGAAQFKPARAGPGSVSSSNIARAIAGW
jgi:hypothetical protein